MSPARKASVASARCRGPKPGAIVAASRSNTLAAARSPAWTSASALASTVWGAWRTLRLRENAASASLSRPRRASATPSQRQLAGVTRQPAARAGGPHPRRRRGRPSARSASMRNPLRRASRGPGDAARSSSSRARVSAPGTLSRCQRRADTTARVVCASTMRASAATAALELRGLLVEGAGGDARIEREAGLQVPNGRQHPGTLVRPGTATRPPGGRAWSAVVVWPERAARSSRSHVDLLAGPDASARPVQDRDLETVGDGRRAGLERRIHDPGGAQHVAQVGDAKIGEIHAPHLVSGHRRHGSRAELDSR